MKQFLLTMAGVFAGLTVFLVGVPFLLIVIAAGAVQPATLPSRTVLELDLRQGLTDQDPQNPLAAFGGRGLSVISVVEALHRAQSDNRVKAVFVRLPEGGMAPAAADELRQAFRRFQKVGDKPVWAYSQGLYPAGVVTSTYMLGASASEMWMQPASSFQVTGLTSEDLFFKRAFDKYGVEADFEQRQEYKNAVNPFLHSDYTPAHREAERAWMNSIYRTAILTAAADRKRPGAAFLETIEAGPYSAEEARALGLIDHVAQLRDAEAALLAKAGDGAEMVAFGDYISRSRRAARASALLDGQAVAIVGGEGPIMTGSDKASNPFASGETIWSDDLAEAIYDAIEDDDVKAIVLRVSSPGGSDTASEQILAAVRAARAADKPVVVSMGTYAASGGYWIASQADEIVAQPTTLTGSIGLFGGKFALGEALARFGVDVRSITVGADYSAAFTIQDGFTPEQRAKFAAWMDRIYDRFIARVAEGRKLPPERVREIARGRVWTGEQAKALGLVDHLGGYYDAVERAKALAGLKGEVRLKHMRGAPSPFEALERMLGVSATSVRALAASAWLLGDPRAEALMDQLVAARLRQGGAHVLAPTPVG